LAGAIVHQQITGKAAAIMLRRPKKNEDLQAGDTL
jgi:hypothetical protein